MHHWKQLSFSSRPRVYTFLGATAFMVGAWMPLPIYAAGTHTTIVLSGSAATGFPVGAVFDELSIPSLNNSGVVGFDSFISQGAAGIDDSNNFGYWLATESNLQLGFRTGSAAPGLPAGVTFAADALVPHTVDDLGRLAFAWRVQGGMNSGAGGVWTGTPGNVELLAQDGGAAPAIPGATNNTFDLPPVIAYQTNGGTVMLGATNSFPTVLWRGQPNSLSFVAHSYGAAPEMGDRVVFDRISRVAVSLSGRVAFQANVFHELDGGGINGGNDSGLWSDGGGALKLIAREGASAPGTDGVFGTFEQPSINQQGRIAFRGSIEGAPNLDVTNNEAIWKEAGAGLELAAREGSMAPGGLGAVFDLFSDPLSGSGERVAFGAKLRSNVAGVNQGNDTGLWGSLSGTLDLVVREGHQAPGLPGGVLFGDIAFTSAWTANDAGALAFLVDLDGTGVTSFNDRSLWAQWPDGSLEMVAREGDLFSVAPGDSRRIDRVDFATGGDLRASSLTDGWNDKFQLAFHLEFNDGTEGLFLANIPEPGSAAMLLCGAFFLGMQRKRAASRRVI